MLKSKLLALSLMTTIVFAQPSASTLFSAVTRGSPDFQALKWYRVSAEQKAAYIQTFNQGLTYVKANYPKDKKWGVVLDIDETTLDNSWAYLKYEGIAITDDEFSEYIVFPEQSTALPGVKNFTCQVKKLGGYVSLVSNRDGSYTNDGKNVLTSTINNLKKEGICFDQVVLENLKQQKDKASDKNPRFNAITHGTCDDKLMVCSNKLPAHDIVAYFGDNIQDFPKLKQKNLVNISADNSIYDKFGNGYFILPNPVYGSWGGFKLK